MNNSYVIGIQIFFLIFGRVIGFFIASPFWNYASIYFRFKNTVALLMSFILLPVIQESLGVSELLPFSNFWFFLIKNIVIGLTIGFFVLILFSIFQMVGEIWGIQIGFSLNQVLDPASGNQFPVMSQLVQLFALLIFISLEGHIRLIELLYWSFEQISVVQDLRLSSVFSSLVEGMVLLFRSTVILSLTLMGSVFIATLFIGLLSKVAPQLNVILFGMPVYVIIGLLIFIYFVPNFMTFMGNYMDHMFSTVASWIKS